MPYRPILDQARWVSALIVALGHTFVIVNSRAHGSVVINYLADMRGAAVCVFFVLSGYLLGGSVLHDPERFDFRRYCIARFARIYVVLVPALVLTVLLDGLAFHFFPNSPLYAGLWQGGVLGGTTIFSRYSAAGVAGSILSLEPLFGEPIGSAGTLWSLGYEWMFYFAFPALYCLGYRLRGRRCGDALVFASILLCFWLSRSFCEFWLIWLLGAYASRLPLSAAVKSQAAQSRLKLVGGLAVVGLVITNGSMPRLAVMFGIGIGGYVFLAARPAWEHRLVLAHDRLLASFSYSLYVTHMQCLVFLAALAYRAGWLPADGVRGTAASLVACGALLGIVVALAYGFAQLFETRAPALSRRLAALILSNRTRSELPVR